MFLIYLYQRYIYRIDPKRVNEFGTSQETWEQNGSVTTDEAGDRNPEAITGSDTEKPEEKTPKEKKED